MRPILQDAIGTAALRTCALVPACVLSRTWLIASVQSSRSAGCERAKGDRGNTSRAEGHAAADAPLQVVGRAELAGVVTENAAVVGSTLSARKFCASMRPRNVCVSRSRAARQTARRARSCDLRAPKRRRR